MIAHEQAVEFLYELQFGKLDEENRAALEAHLTECAECCGYLETYSTLHAALLQIDESEGEHPTAEQIVAFALTADELPGAERQQIDAHVAACGPCTRQLETVRRVEADTPRQADLQERAPARGRSWRGPGFGFVPAAAALIAALAYPAYLGFIRLPRVTEQVERLRDEKTRLTAQVTDMEALRSWSGPIDLKMIRSPLRQGAAPARVVVDPRQPFILLAVELTIPRDLPDDAILRFEIEGADHGAGAGPELTAAEARTQIHSAGVVTLLLPSSALSAEQHLLRVTEPSRQAGFPLLEVPFVVDRPADSDAGR